MTARLAWEVGALLALALLLAPAAAADAAGSQAARRSAALTLSGGPTQAITVCGRPHRALVVAQGTAAAIRVRLRKGRRALLAVSRCSAGRWSRLRLSSLRR